ncbi:MAG: 16S rRNA (guanine(966)-N(2))-methyltransferase RsmD [Parasporobacterium sp.]|nr:16S rRNA (guanine(966)-N(2))-methyltransferase RsmD [Parasporobacterium sp.]
MRVIAGTARRLNLKTPPGLDTRPTIDRIKETLFNILAPDIPGCRFLDLFSGSGSIGIEALSRGAIFSAFVDNNPKAVSCIRENLEHTHLDQNALVLQKNALSAISELSFRKMTFDMVYLDPPYQAGLEQQTLEQLAGSGIINGESLIIIEADIHNNMEFLENLPFDITREKEYKTNKHVFLRLHE